MIQIILFQIYKNNRNFFFEKYKNINKLKNQNFNSIYIKINEYFDYLQHIIIQIIEQIV